MTKKIIVNDLENLNWKQRDVLNLTGNKMHQYNNNKKINLAEIAVENFE